MHRVAHDTWKNGDWLPGQNFDNTGRLPDPVNTTEPQPGGDFWPGQISRTHVGVTRYGYRDVMAGLRAGRVWVDHAQLVDGIDVRVNRRHGIGRGATLGGRLRVRRGENVELTVTVTTATRPNHHGEIPRLAHLDVIRGAVPGPVADRDDWRAPDTKVVHTTDVEGRRGRFTLRIPGAGRLSRSTSGCAAATGGATAPASSARPSTRTARSRTSPATVTRGSTRGATRTRCSWTWCADAPVRRGVSRKDPAGAGGAPRRPGPYPVQRGASDPGAQGDPLVARIHVHIGAPQEPDQRQSRLGGQVHGQ